ncbi:MAG TPA: adenylate/guanylate cyclase domain-containing protein [Reyranella sp.]|nr:adenylate/guanylate cyclase domain-containing protein [Reyranella sp.]
MTAAEPAPPEERPIRWGLARKLFATLLLLGAVAVLVTAILGYVRARDALEATIYNQLTAARRFKARQIETYFRTTRDELHLLASSKMVADAMRSMDAAVDELNQKGVSPEIHKKVDDWYAANVVPELKRLRGREVKPEEYLPATPAAYYLQYHYIVDNPHPAEQRKLLDDAGDGSAYSKAHALYHPLLRAAATTSGFWDLMLADAQQAELIYGVVKEVDFVTSLQTGPYRRSNVATAVARCLATNNPGSVCFEDYAAYAPSDGAPIAFMSAPVIDKGKTIGVLIAQLSIDEIDKVVTGDRQWTREGFGMSGEAYVVGPDHRLRSGLRDFYEDRTGYFASLAAQKVPTAEIDAIRRYGTPILQQKVDSRAARAAVNGLEGTGELDDYSGTPTLVSWGPLAIPGVTWGIVAKIDSTEAFAPVARLQRDLLLVGGLALAAVIVIGAWLSRSLAGPLAELTDGVRRFAAGNYDVKVRARTHDEIGQLCTAFNGMVDEIHAKNDVIEAKNREVEQLLLNVLPAPIANRLREGEKSIADGFAEVSVAFADIVGFTALSSTMPPEHIVALLNGLFTRFDQAAQELGIEKIKTVGDAYMAVCGLPHPVENHAERMVRMAIRMVHITREHGLEHRVPFRLRIGVNTGPVVAGVIGRSKYIYDLWGDTVNLASRMEANGVPDTIQVTRPVYERLKDLFVFEPRGEIEVKGKGSVEAWLLRV